MLLVKLRHLGRSRHDHGEQGREVAIDGASAAASRENRAGHADRRIDGQSAGGADLEQPAEIRDGVDQRRPLPGETDTNTPALNTPRAAIATCGLVKRGCVRPNMRWR